MQSAGLHMDAVAETIRYHHQLRMGTGELRYTPPPLPTSCIPLRLSLQLPLAAVSEQTPP